jgi:hypothetical protein
MRSTPLASAVTIMAIAMLSCVTLAAARSCRCIHLAAIGAGIRAAQLSARSWKGRGLLGALLIGQLFVAASTGPDYLAYFNPLAGSHPEKILANSDLYWGRDVTRVAAELRRREIIQVATALHSNADLRSMVFPPIPKWNGTNHRRLDCDQP